MRGGGGGLGFHFFLLETSRNAMKHVVMKGRSYLIISWYHDCKKFSGYSRLLDFRKRKLRETAEDCRREGLVFLPFAVETLGGLHQGAVTQVKLLASALARCKGLEEGEVTGQIFGRLSLTLMKANALMISTRRQDADFPLPQLDGIEWRGCLDLFCFVVHNSNISNALSW